MVETTGSTNRNDVVVDAEQLADDGRLADAIELLAAADRDSRQHEIEERLVQLRHLAAIAETTNADTVETWPTQDAAPPPGSGIPEVAAAELSVESLRHAIHSSGALLVRGLLERSVATDLCADARRAIEAFAAHNQGAPSSETTPWYVPFEAAEGYQFGGLIRSFTGRIGGVLTVESPRLLQRVIEAFHDVGFGDLLAAYFGERAAISARKSTLRRATSESPSEWHQDGAFLGRQTRTLNAWVALTPCGIDAPGIEVFPVAFDEIVETGTHGALFDWSVGDRRARSLEETAVIPTFESGDALLFDQMTLHRTSVDTTMTEERFAIESWFFATSTYPHEQVPIWF